MATDALWVSKYRPNTMDNYIFKNEALKLKMQEWIDKAEIPHIAFFGPAGTGKTSAYNVLLNGLYETGEIDPADVITLNMSDEGIDAVRLKIDAVARLQPFGKYRIFILEEMEQMSHKAQGSLKRITEDYEENARFIITSNEPHKILKPIISRFQVINIESHDRDQFMEHILGILIKEGVELDTEESIELLGKYINSTYPDFRKTLNLLQQSVIGNKLVRLEESIDGTASYKMMIIDALQNGQIRKMRETIVQNVPDDEIDEFFTFLYNNAELFSTDEVTLLKIKVKIRDALVKGASVSDRELNLSALLCELDLICSGML